MPSWTRALRTATLAAVILVSAGCDGRAPEAADRSRTMRPCDVPRTLLQPVARGYVPGRSGDVLAIERYPNSFGTRHSSPHPYTQDVPLVLYGPGYIAAGKTSDRPVTLADVAPTLAELLRFDGFPGRDGRVLTEAFLPRGRRAGVPRLVFVLVWDGGGDNVLERWPRSWPALRALAAGGTSFTNATVGSSPSITPSVHATLGTGAFPSAHGISDIKMRVRGRVVDAWDGLRPDDMRVRTLADLWDAANANAPEVGIMARDGWHLGMMGQGAWLPEGDRDIAILDRLTAVGFHTNTRFYAMPPYVGDPAGLRRAVGEVDGRDGEIDGMWLGNPISAEDPQVRYTPAFSIYQSEQIVEVLEREGFGRDDVSDLFFTNYKSTDLAGHAWNMVEPEVRHDLEEQDAQLEFIVEALDRLVGRRRYVLVITADHGMTPYPAVTGGWNIRSAEVTKDLQAAFDDDPATPFLLGQRGYMYWLRGKELRRNGASPEAVARWLRDYRIGDNVPRGEPIPRSWRSRRDERVFLTAFTPEQMRRALRCAGAREGIDSGRGSSTGARQP